MSVSRHLGSLSRDTVVYGLSGTVTRVLAIFLVPLYTRVLAPDQYGVRSLLESIVTLLAMFAVLGLDNSAARWFYDSEDEGHRRTTIASWFWCQAILSTLLALPLIVASGPLSRLLFEPGGKDDVGVLLVICGATLPLFTVQKVLSSWLRFQRRAWLAATFTTATTVLTIGATVALVLVWRMGLFGVFAARLYAAVPLAVLGLFVMRRWITPRRFDARRLREMLVFGFPLMPAAVGMWAVQSSDRWILKMYQPMAVIGLYSVAGTIASALSLFTAAFDAASGPFAFSIHREEESGRVFARLLDLYAWGGCTACAGLGLLAPWLLRIFTTEAYVAAAPCVPYLAFTVLLASAMNIAAIGPALAKKSLPVAKSIFLNMALSLALNFTLIPFVGIEGAAFTAMAASFAAVAYLFAQSQRCYPIPYRFGPAVACFAVSWALIVAGRFTPTAGLAGLLLRGALLGGVLASGPVLGLVHLRELRAVLCRLPFPGRGRGVPGPTPGATPAVAAPAEAVVAAPPPSYSGPVAAPPGATRRPEDEP